MKNELQELYKQVQEGSTRAMIRIARIYYWGLSVDPDTQKAIEWLRSAVAKNLDERRHIRETEEKIKQKFN